MRDPERIPEVLSEIDKVWRKYPDLRLGQLLVILQGHSEFNSVFYMEDDELVRVIEEYGEGLGGETGD